MKKFLAKRVRILGKSFSLALIVGLLVVSLVGASLFYNMYFGRLNFTSGRAPSAVFYGAAPPVCSVNVGAITLCEIVDGNGNKDIAIAGTGLAPGSIITVDYTVEVNYMDAAFSLVYPAAPDWVGVITDSCTGTTLAFGTQHACQFTVAVDDEMIEPNVTLDELDRDRLYVRTALSLYSCYSLDNYPPLSN